MKDCLRLHTDDEAREMRIGYLTMLLHTAKSEERRRELMEELEAIRAEKVVDGGGGVES